MPGISMIIHSPALFLRIAINVATVVAAISVTAAGISVGVVVAKLAAQSASTGSSNPLFDTTVVLQSSSSLVFNRIIQPTFDTMTTNSENTNHCNISMYYDGSAQPALIYLNGTLYFNSTQQNKPNATVIIDALASFDPVIILIDKCLQKSPAESTFNSALSTVQPLSVVDSDASVLDKNNTYSLPLISLTNSVTTPQLSTITTITTTTTTTTTVTQSTTPLFG
ncbi:unnamed protein product [Adineta steineri]|uniref:Uncharacterized protein n=1 Tax=Adineta steineri TaxID=433720 RepID=A0A815NSK0_9BILA|nr:unnamed protein product [Adineta steineri]CAF4117170.1 unnamed protein product [Adineta steineri]